LVSYTTVRLHAIILCMFAGNSEGWCSQHGWA